MRRLRLVMIGAVIAMMGSAVSAYAQTAPFTLTLRADKTTVISGRPIRLEITIKNLSDHNVDCSSAMMSDGVNMSFGYNVIGPSGEPARRIPRTQPYTRSGSVYLCTLPPGKSSYVLSSSRINALYDMREPGIYRVRVRRWTKGHLAVWSNTVQIRVLPQTGHSKG